MIAAEGTRNVVTVVTNRDKDNKEAGTRVAGHRDKEMLVDKARSKGADHRNKTVEDNSKVADRHPNNPAKKNKGLRDKDHRNKTAEASREDKGTRGQDHRDPDHNRDLLNRNLRKKINIK